MNAGGAKGWVWRENRSVKFPLFGDVKIIASRVFMHGDKNKSYRGSLLLTMKMVSAVYVNNTSILLYRGLTEHGDSVTDRI